MRLLKVSDLTFYGFADGKQPKYVIASHRWVEGTEATFVDVAKQRNVEKPGYQKVVHFAEYVKQHVSGIEWLWIDTCCIDKRDTQEVSEAINSMFKWYAEAEACLAFLLDVDSTDTGDLMQSEWFERGWTLQELLAPRIVVFLNRNWKVIGHKGPSDPIIGEPSLCLGRPLVRLLSKITRIPEDILQEFEKSSSLSADEKIGWMSDRKTTRPEDTSYGLFGILDLAIGANYGEGGDKARRRLLRAVQEIHEVSELGQGGNFPKRSTISSFRQHRDLTDSDCDAEQVILHSLHFSSMNHREHQIYDAHQNTYQWALHGGGQETHEWDSLTEWLGNERPTSSIYWISGKPGAGKSSLVRFLGQTLRSDEHMQPWAQDKSVTKLQYFFWSAGDRLQKSLEGLLRTVLYQLFVEFSGLIKCLAPESKWRAALLSPYREITWTVFELRDCIDKVIHSIASSSKVLILIDGLDELCGKDHEQHELVNIIKTLSQHINIKLCVSSRTWPVFTDAFDGCLRMRLEDPNARDIEKFTFDKLGTSPRYRQLSVGNRDVQDLVRTITGRAQGVFLWAALVVRDLIQGLQDGDAPRELRKKLDAIPSDLDKYFTQILQSIAPEHRKEGCTIQLLASHYESVDASLRLIDLAFTQYADSNFALTAKHEALLCDFSDAHAIWSMLDANLRKLNTCCRGLLECFPALRDVECKDVCDSEAWFRRISTHWKTGAAISSLPYSMIEDLHGYEDKALDFRIDFMHRTLRDYLDQHKLDSSFEWNLSDPPDADMFAVNACLAKAFAFCATQDRIAVLRSIRVAEYVLTTIQRSDRCDTQIWNPFILALEPLIRSMRKEAHRLKISQRRTKLQQILCAWDDENSSMLTLAAEFGLTGYLDLLMTAEAIKSKTGRPMLHYVALTPVELRAANLKTVQLLLNRGADPNQTYLGISTWAAVLNEECLNLSPPWNKNGFVELFQMMIRHGAATSFTRRELSTFVGNRNDVHTLRLSRDELFLQVWNDLVHREPLTGDDEQEFQLFNILESFRPYVGEGIDSLQALLREREKSDETAGTERRTADGCRNHQRRVSTSPSGAPRSKRLRTSEWTPCPAY